MSVAFTWSVAKAKSNLAKHGVSFEEAATVLLDPLELTEREPVHPERSVSIGMSDKLRVIVLVYTETPTMIRIISARLATRRERTTYEEGS